MKQPKITVIGSINMDMLTITDDFPNQGETVRGNEMKTAPGGKGANQAVSASRLGANVQMIGKVGQDAFGQSLLQSLEKEKVSTRFVKEERDVVSGVANIILSDNDNRIIIIPGANHQVTPEFVEEFKQEILNSDIVLIQFEIPKETILYCIDLCYNHDIPIIVNPAPAMELPYGYWLKATYITPNETEAGQLFHQEELKEGSDLAAKLIITRGDKGVTYFTDGKLANLPAFKVTSVDTTGAGDTFNAALGVAISEQKDIQSALKFATGASALAIQKLGAQSGMPTRSEVEKLL